jgi:hypothetical protein
VIRNLALALAAVAAIGHAPPEGALAQLPAEPKPETQRVTSTVSRTSEEIDRFEIGAAFPDDYFDVLASLGYRRFMREGGPFEQSLQIELAGMKQDYLFDAAASVYYLFRPLKSYREEWRLRPLLEFGPGAHLDVQVAEIEGFNETAFHGKGYLKMHGYFGAEWILTRGFGIMAKGRLGVPNHKVLDYAQAAIFLR